MPLVKRRKRKEKSNEPVKEEAESESGCLSTRLSRTRLGKENLSRLKTPKQVYSNPYDGDIESELEVLDTIQSSPMAMDHEDSEPGESYRNVNIMDTQSLDADHSTPFTAAIPHQPSDENCFGFESLHSPIPLSPIIASLPLQPLGMKSSMSITPRKRKKTAASHVPIEDKKLVKKKKQMKFQPEFDQDWAFHLNQEFEQIDQLKLVIE